ncbi:MAG: hypothetical protein J5I93_20105 [Pirellulaceae bacterium]|nr:hypothetical protein [Pirellulaceae bacterium]
MRDSNFPSPCVRPAAADVSRRTFLSAMAASTAACGLAAKAAGAANPATARGLATWTVSDFESLRGDLFLVRDAAGRTNHLRLETAAAASKSAPSGLGAAPSGPRRAAFSLLFRSPPEGPARQDVYELRHPNLGTFSLLLVPVDRPCHAVVLEAIIS